ncbi:dTDP-4-amino-4,6-dideoxygalactose transaminase [Marinobacter sp. es.042]|uniref:DegT/DnrJ/EryC1/StrS family aminotransferase n=1 Tax=Marinobacter sp. es.042 TaxID=1761794 RepID=UPI000B50FFDE|nr:DegT/DnrJ/EryC1/StrS family aminotransferase [Marinobacter sp. es.042]SNB55501.1 dTDP-4-amino-4,6-dideoxygalactose transaminase [Marinobacter sp. es.042]
MIGKLRPVGSHVPLPLKKEGGSVPPWELPYRTYFMGSGTEALSAAIKIAIRRKPRILKPEVVVPAYGCPDLIAAIVAQGAKPVLVDLEPNSSFMNEDGIRQAISSSTVAVVGVGFLGITERLELLAHICCENRLFLIEDSAQCFPPARKHSLADCIVLSFGRGKPINLMGGGALLVRRAIAEDANATLGSYPLKLLKVDAVWHIRRVVFNLLLGRISYDLLERLPQLRIGETRFNRIEKIVRLKVPVSLLLKGIQDFRLRPRIHLKYDQQLSALETKGWVMLSRNLHKADGAADSQVMLRYPLLAPDRETRNRAIQMLNSRGIGASKFYERPIAEIEGVGEFLPRGHYPVAKDISERLLTLPTHEDVKQHHIDLIDEILSSISQN